MKEDIFQDGFEDFLRESSDDLRMHPSDRAWKGLQARMHPAPRWPYLLGAAGIFGLGLMTGIWLNPDGRTDTRSASPSNPEPTGRHRAVPAQAKPLWERASLEATMVSLRHIPDNAPVASDSARIPEDTEREPSATPTRTGTALPSLAQYLPRTGAGPEPTRTSLLHASGNRQVPRHAGMASPTVLPATGSAASGDESAAWEVPTNDRLPQIPGSLRRRTSLKVYLTPSVSYRNLIGQATRSQYSFSTGYSPNAGFGAPTDVNDAVTHKPGIGLEAGTALQYTLTRSLRVRAGLQFNLTNYDIEAYTYAPELAPLSAANGNGGRASIQSLSYFRNATGFSRTWLRNSHFMVSVPLGLEYTVADNRRLSLTVASTLQPTYMLRNRSYLISTNLKNYAEEPSLYRRWNLNAGAEAYLSINTGSYRWIMGPQIRYQLLSSYKKEYPIQEHLVDFGFKVGIQKTIR